MAKSPLASGHFLNNLYLLVLFGPQPHVNIMLNLKSMFREGPTGISFKPGNIYIIYDE